MRTSEAKLESTDVALAATVSHLRQIIHQKIAEWYYD